MKTVFLSHLWAGCRAVGVEIASSQADLMWRHFELLSAANERMNLTRITEPAEAAVKHYADSLSVIRLLDAELAAGARLLDVGSGGGFPGFPIAIARPGWAVTCIDSTGKKARFLQETAAELGLDNLTALQARGVEYKPDRPFDAAMFRAVAQMGDCLAESRRLVRTGGWVACYKAATIEPAEMDGAKVAAKRFGFARPIAQEVHLPLGEQTLTHRLYVWRKT